MKLQGSYEYTCLARAYIVPSFGLVYKTQSKILCIWGRKKKPLALVDRKEGGLVTIIWY